MWGFKITMNKNQMKPADQSIKSLLTRVDSGGPGAGARMPTSAAALPGTSAGDPLKDLRALDLHVIAAAANDDQSLGGLGQAGEELTALAGRVADAARVADAGPQPPPQPEVMPKCVSEARPLVSGRASGAEGSVEVSPSRSECEHARAGSNLPGLVSADRSLRTVRGLWLGGVAAAAVIVPMAIAVYMFQSDFMAPIDQVSSQGASGLMQGAAATPAQPTFSMDRELSAGGASVLPDDTAGLVAPGDGAFANSQGGEVKGSPSVTGEGVQKDDPVMAEGESDAPGLVLDVKAGSRVALPLELGPANATADVGALVLRGLPHGFVMTGASAAGDGSWVLAPQQLEAARVEVPAQASGNVDLSVTLFDLAAVEVGRTTVRLTVKGAGLGGREMPAARAEALVMRGMVLLEVGDVAAARLLFVRAAEGGHGRAALLAGETYDPVKRAMRGVVGHFGDVDRARDWYGKALARGITEAKRQLAKLDALDKPPAVAAR